MQLRTHGPRPTVEAFVCANSSIAVAACWLIETRSTAEASSSSGVPCYIYPHVTIFPSCSEASTEYFYVIRNLSPASEMDEPKMCTV